MLKAVIIYLTRRQDIKDLKISLYLLNRFFTKRYNYPVIIINDDFNEEDKKKLSIVHPNIIFEKISFEIPSWIDKNKALRTKYSVGYRHMCRFFAGELYKLDIMKDYDWYWRLDSDSFLHSPINYDIFNFLEQNGYIYGFVGRILKDDPNMIEGLWDFTKKYIHNNKTEPKFLDKHLNKNGVYDGSLYYTNFEISKLNFWHSENYMRFYNAIDKNGGIFYNRWGDAVIHFLALSMFVDEKKIHCFKDIDYSHGYFRPNQYYRLFSLTKKYNLSNFLIKYNLNLIKENKFYTTLNRYFIYKVVDILNKLFNYKQIKDEVYCINYA